MNDYIGSSFDEFLEEENLWVEMEVLAIKRPLIKQIAEYLKENKLSKTDFAKQMKINVSQLNRFLDSKNANLNLKNLVALAKALGKQVEVNFVD
ncbi:helix-turn-helix domain-containing protein [Legionella brunensis]|uniref:Helix-turn-helix protein n=1 Tax=Legionella brunensis TaxID=29422 RepID=A0A0W0S4P6_9GAMM|nr:helix-turn-helix transcriptional regulator [Legionella brunensis]KTC77997.1 helix-turn-helix protein [Legionella brunensis]